MSRKIQDEFTDLPMSKEMKCMLRKQRDGKCMTCGRPRVNAKHCAYHRDYANRLHREMDAKHPEKAKARSLVMQALRKGIIKREPCHCGKPGFAHHEDHNKPLEITWLCHAHHNEAHGKTAIKKDHAPFIKDPVSYYKKYYSDYEEYRRQPR